MSMKDRYILEALQKAVIAAVADSSTPSLYVKMAGRVAEPQSADRWLEVIHIPNNFDGTWGEEKTYQGLLRLMLHTAVDDKGAYGPMDIITSIGNYFTKGRKLPNKDPNPDVEVTVTTNPEFMGIMEEAPDVLYPISIEYRVYDA